VLFSSQIFILLFLPLVVGIFHSLPASAALRLHLLTFASMVFYGWWDPRFLPLLVVMIGANWLIARAYSRSGRSALISIGVALNLAVLGGFKYANFFAEAVLGVMGVEFQRWSIILPLGISFFTFQQISYLVDLRRGEARVYPFADYAAYVSFFPQLIAGPIVRHNELIPQFARLAARIDAECVARGLVLFILGLCKKVFFADELAPLADAGFEIAAAGDLPQTALAWQSALAYSLQLYFDFSSYSDMAMGLAGLFGFDLPVNFDRPYRATSIREFWRRWHMTLSRFLRDYVYIPLGGNRGGRVMTAVIVLTTMLLCGLWHGAGWAFILWGGAHGLAVCVNQLWAAGGMKMPAGVAWALTLFFVIVAWVLFRAENLADAARVLQAMFSNRGGVLEPVAWLYIVIGGLFALLGPTNAEFAHGRWVAHRGAAIALGLALVLVVLRVGQGRGLEFIYFQF
jgi:alginate O-acetyltransferase complex protein AlgI